MTTPALPPEPPASRFWTLAETAGGATAWGAVGTVAASLVALLIPDVVVADAIVSGMGGSLCSALYVLGVLRKRRPKPFERLEAELRNVDQLFVRGVIDQEEYVRLRQSILEKWSARGHKA